MATRELEFPVPLSEKYRPKKVEEFVGLLKAKRILGSFIQKPFDSAWLFIGPSGVGKTTMALAMVEQLNAELHHIPSRSCDLETVDSVTRMCWSAAFNFKTGESCSYHIVLVDEADQMTPAAQNSLLSKLDATAAPPRTIFIFTCNNKQSLEGRFLSRCREVPFEYEALENDLEGYLAKIYKKEGGKHPLDFEAIAKNCGFNVRDCLMKLELELMIGVNRKDLPTEDLKIVEAHKHFCKKHRKHWLCSNANCELPYSGVCPTCGGAKTVGTLRANKAWDTIRKNIKTEVLAEVNGKKKGKKK